MWHNCEVTHVKNKKNSKKNSKKIQKIQSTDGLLVNKLVKNLDIQPRLLHNLRQKSDHMASVLRRIEAEHGVSTSVDTRDQKLTLFRVNLICFSSRTAAKTQK